MRRNGQVIQKANAPVAPDDVLAVTEQPRYVSREEVPANVLEHEREIARAKAKNDPKNANKPEQVIEKIVEGMLNKFYEEAVLVDQPFVKDPAKTVGELVTEKVAKTGERIAIRRFTRYKMGEGLERREEDFGSEVASLVTSDSDS